MKMKLEHFQNLKSLIEPIDTEERRARYKQYHEADSSDLNKRYRWGCLYATNAEALNLRNLYAYLNDDHIDTALRKLVKPL